MRRMTRDQFSRNEGYIKAIAQFIAVIAFIIACTAATFWAWELGVFDGHSDSSVVSGTARDTLFSVEPTKGGSYNIWLTHDDVASYCTDDDELGEKATAALINHHGEIVIVYSSRPWYSGSGCASYGATAEGGGTVTFNLEGIELVQSRYSGR